MSRFQDLNDEDVNDLKNASKCKNTSNSTGVWVRAYDAWRKERLINEKLEETDPEILNKRLEQFFTQLRKQNGAEYQPKCLNVMLSALDRELKNKDCKFSLYDRAFYSAREVLNGKAKVLRQQGYGDLPNKADGISPGEEDMLWDTGCLGVGSPRILINTLWWILNQQCGGRGQEGHYDLEIDEFSLTVDDVGRQYIKYTEGPSKTRQGGLKFKPRPVFPRMYATGGQRCPVKTFFLFQSKRPQAFKTAGPLYLSPIDNPKDEQVWYKRARMGINQISAIVKNIVVNSPLATNGKHYTNHSVRKTTVKKLIAEGIPKEDIRTVTGHKHSDSLDAYDSGDEDVLYKLSTTLSKEPNSTPQTRSTNTPSCSKEVSPPPTSVQPQIIYKQVHGNVYNITVQNCKNVSVPTNAPQGMVSSPKFSSKRLKCIVDSSPDSSQ